MTFVVNLFGQPQLYVPLATGVALTKNARFFLGSESYDSLHPFDIFYHYFIALLLGFSNDRVASLSNGLCLLPIAYQITGVFDFASETLRIIPVHKYIMIGLRRLYMYGRWLYTFPQR